MGRKSKKKAKPKAVPSSAAASPDDPEKEPKAERITDDRPSWRFHKADRDGPFSIENVSADDSKVLLERIMNWESMHWNEFFGPRDNCHTVYLEKMTPEAHKRLRELGMDQIEALDSLRITGERRLWGIIERSVFHVFWWDPHHKVAKVRKR